MGDSGLSGRKIIVDTYGGMARHGGGSFSGKDPTKVDRSGAYMARYVAKNVVAAGLARRCELQLAYAIGVAHPLAINVQTFGTGTISDAALAAIIERTFDLRPGAIIGGLDLRRPIYRQTAAYGHFGREDLDLPWERLDRVDELRAAARLRLADGHRPRARPPAPARGASRGLGSSVACWRRRAPALGVSREPPPARPARAAACPAPRRAGRCRTLRPSATAIIGAPRRRRWRPWSGRLAPKSGGRPTSGGTARCGTSSRPARRSMPTRQARRIGDLRAAAGDPGSARRYYAEAIDEARDIGAEHEQGLAALGLGRSLLELGDVTGGAAPGRCGGRPAGPGAGAGRRDRGGPGAAGD